ncbi:MAG: hypothetical protein WCG97_00945 [bacterium]
MDLKKNQQTLQKNFQNKNSRTDSAPSKTILILGAVCFSIILGSVAYKIAIAQRALHPNDAIIGLQGTTTDLGNVVTNAIQDAQDNSNIEGLATSSDPFAPQPGDSVSDRVTKKIFSGYMYAQQTDGVTDQSTADVTSVVMGQINQSDLPQPEFLANQVHFFVPTSKDQIKQYGNNLADVIVQNYQIVANNKEKYANNLTEMAKIYSQIGYNIMKVKAPIEMNVEQSSLANSFVLASEGMKMVALQETDPVKSLLGLKTVKEVGQSQSQVLINISQYFKKNDIIFSTNDSGAFWNQFMNLKINDQSTQQNNATGN